MTGLTENFLLRRGCERVLLFAIVSEIMRRVIVVIIVGVIRRRVIAVRAVRTRPYETVRDVFPNVESKSNLTERPPVERKRDSWRSCRQCNQRVLAQAPKRSRRPSPRPE